MSFKQGLIRARSHLIFLFGLLTAFILVIWLEGITLQQTSNDKFTDLMETTHPQ
ncbi:MAG: Unknown protein, partial [uncultured Thiotrichaceae bacterium]